MEKKWFKSALAMLLVIAMVAGIVPNIPDSVSEAEAAYTANGTADVTIFAEDEDGTGRFPDVTRLADDSLVAVCYWNSVGTHAPNSIADGNPLGKVKISYGSADGKTWSDAKDLITPEKLAEWGLGIWCSVDDEGNKTFYYTAEDAATDSDAKLVVEARDPNLEVMDDGTLLLTFFTRVPHECNFNGYTFESSESADYNIGRTYIMYSKDKGDSWSVPTEVHSDLMVHGTAKRGSMALYPDGYVLIPLQGYDEIQSNAKHGTCVMMQLQSDGTWKFIRETRMWGANGSDESTYTWESEHALAVTTLNGQEVTYDLIRRSGKLLISYDRGINWETLGEHIEKDDSYYEGAAEYLQQPNIYNIDGSNQLFFTWTQAVGTNGQRDVYGKIYTPGEDWTDTEAILLYKNYTGGGNDIGDPTGIQLANGELFTVYYDVAARTVGAVFNTVDELVRLRSENELQADAAEWKFYEQNFDGETEGNYLDQSGAPLWMDVTNGSTGDGTAKVTTDSETGNKYLVMNGDTSTDQVEFWFNEISPDTTISFDFQMPSVTTNGMQQWLVGIGTGHEDVLNWQFTQSKGADFVRLCNSSGTLASVHYNGNETAEAKRFDDVFEIGEWYSVKFVWDGYRTFMKLWKQADVEPDDYMFEAQNINFMRDNKIYMRFGTTVESSLYMDNLNISKHTKLSIVEKGDNTLGYEFNRDITNELPTPKVTWSSSDSSVVSIDENGQMTYVSEGTATITATCDNLVATKEIVVEGSWKFHEMDFEDAEVGGWTATDKYGLVLKTNNDAVAEVRQEDENQYLAITGDDNTDITELWFDASSASTLSFDFKMPSTSMNGWGRIYVALGNEDYSAQWQFLHNKGSDIIRMCDSDGTKLPVYYNGTTTSSSQDYSGFTSGTDAPWYSVKFVWDGEWIYVKLWEKGTTEPTDYMFKAQNTAFESANKAVIKFASNVTYTAYLDNIEFSKVTSMSIVEKDSDTLDCVFDRDISAEIPTPEITWNSSDTSVVSIDESGALTRIGEGTATITATCDNLSATKEITVDSWKFHNMNFENDGSGTWTAPDKYGLKLTKYSSATATVQEGTDNNYLVLTTGVGNSSNSAVELSFNSVSTQSTLAFDFQMPYAHTSTTGTWGGIYVALGNTDYSAMWQIRQVRGDNYVRLCNAAGTNHAIYYNGSDTTTTTTISNVFESGSDAPWYSVKFVWDNDWVYVKFWEKGTEEPTDYMFKAQNDAFKSTDKALIKAVASVESDVYLDNITFSKITNFSIVDDGSNTLSYEFDRDVTQELPVPNVVWTSNNEDVVTIDETTGTMTYVGAGTATIKVICDNLVATKEIEVCEVNFDMQGHGGENSSQYLRKGDKAVVPTTPTEESYTFNGWYTEAAGRNAYNFDNAVNENVTVYAKWTYNHNVYDMDFEDAPIGDYLVQDGNGLWMEKDTALTRVERDEATDNQYLVATGDWINFWFNNMGTESTLSFDFQMPTSSTGWDRLAVAVGYRDSDLKYAWKFEQWQGWTSVKYVNAADEDQTYSDAFEIGLWYSVKLEWDNEWISAKIWKKDVAEPESYTFIVKNANFIKDNKVSFNYYTDADSKIYLDNIRFYRESNHAGGDVNGDGVVDVRDLVRLKKHVGGVEHAWGGNCDVDNYGTVDITDLNILRRKYLLGIEE